MTRENGHHETFAKELPQGTWECFFPDTTSSIIVTDVKKGFDGEIKPPGENKNAYVSNLTLPPEMVPILAAMEQEGQIGVFVGSLENGHAKLSNLYVCRFDENIRRQELPAVVDQAVDIAKNVVKGSDSVIGVFKPGNTAVLYELLNVKGIQFIMGGVCSQRPEGLYVQVSAISSNKNQELSWVNIVNPE